MFSFKNVIVMDIVIYAGLAIDIIGAILLMIWSMKYRNAFKSAERMPLVKEELKAEWLKKRAIGFGMIIAGTIITVIGCYI